MGPAGPYTFDNGDTRKELLARSRYVLYKSPEKWTLSQREELQGFPKKRVRRSLLPLQTSENLCLKHRLLRVSPFFRSVFLHHLEAVVEVLPDDIQRWNDTA